MNEPNSLRSAPASPAAYVRVWLVPLLIAFTAALAIRAFVVQAFRIPTESMERTLLVDDYVLVSKLHYGPRVPQTMALPFTDAYVQLPPLPEVRLPGFGRVRRGDVIVFNYPVEEGPPERRTHYIKRVVAGPGDSLAIRDKLTYVNGIVHPLGDGMQQQWLARTRPGAVMPLDQMRALGVEHLTSAGRAHSRVAFEGTVAMAQTVASWDEVEAVEPFTTGPGGLHGLSVFPEGSGFGQDHYGPLYVPARGDTLHLTDATWFAYRDVITRFEGHEARRLGDGRFLIDGAITDRYVVEQDYYFVLGDNRDDSRDSRVWGFVPMDHIVGKAVLTYFSWDAEATRPRFDRVFRWIR